MGEIYDFVLVGSCDRSISVIDVKEGRLTVVGRCAADSVPMCFVYFAEGNMDAGTYVQNIAFGDTEGNVTIYDSGTLANQARRFLSMKGVKSNRD